MVKWICKDKTCIRAQSKDVCITELIIGPREEPRVCLFCGDRGVTKWERIGEPCKGGERRGLVDNDLDRGLIDYLVEKVDIHEKNIIELGSENNALLERVKKLEDAHLQHQIHAHTKRIEELERIHATWKCAVCGTLSIGPEPKEHPCKSRIHNHHSWGLK